MMREGNDMQTRNFKTQNDLFSHSIRRNGVYLLLHYTATMYILYIYFPVAS